MSKSIGRINGKSLRMFAIVACMVFLYSICMVALEVDFFELLSAIPHFLNFLFFKFFPPNIASIPLYIKPILDTVFAAILATIISTILATILSFLVAKKTTPWEPLSFIIRAILSLFRNVPILVWASLLTIIFGIGITSGIIALIIFGAAFLTRVLADAIDDVSRGVFEAMQACGATRMELIKHGIIPAYMPSFYAWMLFMLEVNIKASAILGLVGAGGLGYELKKSMDLFQYQEACAIIVVLILMMLAIEFISNRIRRNLI
ncbi:phosphonate ABC transporter, permease protein PhnE [Erysipelotrichaceae bacterium]|nr:phosphonate ABC transporter, permease protein PhnE [Erysipelotrichaceae bacterium]